MTSAYTGSTEGRGNRSTTSSLAEDMAQKAGHQIERAIDTAQATARSAQEQGREATERMGEVAGNMKTALDKSVREQPMATLVLVGALGFVIGALWKS